MEALLPVSKHGDWEVMPTGELRNPKRRIRISPDRLKEGSWWATFRAKTWAADEWNNLMPAFFEACEYAGIAQINIKIDTF